MKLVNNILKLDVGKKNIEVCEHRDILIEVIEVGNHVFTMRDFKIFSDVNGDMFKYTATLCDKGKPLCFCKNEGDVTQVKPIDMSCWAFMITMGKILNKTKIQIKDVLHETTIPKICDALAWQNYMMLERTVKGRAFIAELGI